MSENERASVLSALQEPDRTQQPSDAPRRCFICLTDEDSSDAPGTWVDPCPCTLEAHQDCMLSWVTDCERTNKPLQCPVCKAPIEMEGPRDLVVAFNDMLARKFTKASPYILLTGVSMGVQFSLQMYGVMALWTFAGKGPAMRFLLGPTMSLNEKNTVHWQFLRRRLWNSLVMLNVAPTLLFSQLLPNLSQKIFLPAASLYGLYLTMHDDVVYTWPPSPQMAMAIFPYVRAVYLNFWAEFVLPIEVKLNRQIMGLPPLNPDGNGQAAANQRRQVNGQGGFVGILQGLLDALDPDDDDEGMQIEDGQHGDDGGGVFELRIDGELGGEEGLPGGEIGFQVEIAAAEELREPEAGNEEVIIGEEDQDPNDRDIENAEHAVNGQHDEQHGAPQAPPVRRIGLGGLLSGISNAVVSALILPGISFAMGEALRLVLPEAWTAATPRSPWTSRPGFGSRPALLQQQWGRSLVGGCLYVVLKDVIRVYGKSRMVKTLRDRRIKNVDRRRRG